MENLLIGILLFISGVSLGSFLNVLIDRFSTNRTVVKGRSYCEKCNTTLTWQELIPLFSFLLQKGKCRHCKAEIPTRLFIVELLIGTLLPLLYFWGLSQNKNSLEVISVAIITYLFIGIIFSDLEYGLIPDKFLIIAFIPTLYIAILDPSGIINHLLSGMGAFAFFFFLFFITKGRGMGFGDVKLAFILGLFLGFPLIILSLYIAFLTGAFISIILVVWGKAKLKKSTIPFGPFLVTAAIISYFFGESYLLPLVANYI